jgi:hypothetical protein
MHAGRHFRPIAGINQNGPDGVGAVVKPYDVVFHFILFDKG